MRFIPKEFSRAHMCALVVYVDSTYRASRLKAFTSFQAEFINGIMLDYYTQVVGKHSIIIAMCIPSIYYKVVLKGDNNIFAHKGGN